MVAASQGCISCLLCVSAEPFITQVELPSRRASLHGSKEGGPQEQSFPKATRLLARCLIACVGNGTRLQRKTGQAPPPGGGGAPLGLHRPPAAKRRHRRGQGCGRGKVSCLCFCLAFSNSEKKRLKTGVSAPLRDKKIPREIRSKKMRRDPRKERLPERRRGACRACPGPEPRRDPAAPGGTVSRTEPPPAGRFPRPPSEGAEQRRERSSHVLPGSLQKFLAVVCSTIVSRGSTAVPPPRGEKELLASDPKGPPGKRCAGLAAGEGAGPGKGCRPQGWRQVSRDQADPRWTPVPGRLTARFHLDVQDL